MATAKQQENMLLTEHFTWPPISLIDDIINSMNIVLYKCTDNLESALLSADPSVLGFTSSPSPPQSTTAPTNGDAGEADVSKKSELEINEGIHSLETLMINAIDKNFDRLEIWTLRNVLTLGNMPGDEELGRWIRLAHYQGLQVPPQNPAMTPESLQALRRKVQETQKLHAALLAEKTRNDAQIQRLRSLLQPSSAPKPKTRSSTSPTKPAVGAADGDGTFAFLTHKPAAQSLGVQPLPSNGASTPGPSTDSRTPLTIHAQFTTSQLPYLRQLLASLRPHLASTAPSLKQQGQREDFSRERREYIESRSRRALERRGMDTREGVEGPVEGQRVRTEEVRGLEGIVGQMGKRKGDEDEDGEPMDTS